MKLLVDDEGTPLSELVGTINVLFEYADTAYARRVVETAVRDLLAEGLAELVYVDPPFFRHSERVPIPPEQADAVLADPDYWRNPAETPESRQVRADATPMGQRRFF
jgi:hypothetical protein